MSIADIFSDFHNKRARNVPGNFQNNSGTLRLNRDRSHSISCAVFFTQSGNFTALYLAPPMCEAWPPSAIVWHGYCLLLIVIAQNASFMQIQPAAVKDLAGIAPLVIEMEGLAIYEKSPASRKISVRCHRDSRYGVCRQYIFPL
ncbi:hypothetical protein [Paralcaligenes ginsengisoli]